MAAGFQAVMVETNLLEKTPEYSSLTRSIS